VQKSHLNQRIDGLDVARGGALMAMASYHFCWDLELFGYMHAGTAASGALKLYARAIATSFLFLAGFSLVLATLSGIKWRSFLLRLGQIGAAALVISIVTFNATPESWIFFGILHHIVLASLIGLAALRLNWAIILAGAMAALALPVSGLISTEAPWLSFIGLYEIAPRSNDFVPLLPWLAASLAGIASAKIVVANNWLEILAKPKALNSPWRQLKFLGRHSLLFYILHQPLLIGLVWLGAQFMPPSEVASNAAFQAECRMVCKGPASDGQTSSAPLSDHECETYCNCFERALKDSAAQWSQLSDEDKMSAIGALCSTAMRETAKP
jgi:uncharacterized membrane protein